MFERTRLFEKGGNVALIQASRLAKSRAEDQPRDFAEAGAISASWPNIHLLTVEHGRSFPQVPSFSIFNPVSDFQQLRMFTISLNLLMPNSTS